MAVVKEVWALNLEAEFAAIYNMLPYFSFVAFDTEFPGTVFPQHPPTNPSQHQPFSSPLKPFEVYHTLKRNVDATNIIQLGLTLANAKGEVGAIWEFNFKDFNLARGDLHNPNSIQLLKEQGIDFAKNATHGIDSKKFRKLLLTSGLIRRPYSPVVTWIGFQISYDFGYLLKILIGGRELPNNVTQFVGLIEHCFGKRVYDLKHMMKSCSGLHGGIEKVAKTLDVQRIAGRSHQAGSDSLLTMMTFKKMRDKFFSNMDVEQLKRIHGGVLHGLEIKVLHPLPVLARPIMVSNCISAPPPIMFPQPVMVRNRFGPHIPMINTTL